MLGCASALPQHLSEWCWELHGPSVGFKSTCICFLCRAVWVWDSFSGRIFLNLGEIFLCIFLHSV